jgi:long-chain acyl-CoA synthetase
MTVGVGAVLDRALRERPTAEAVVARSGTLTYAELDAAADHAAGALWALGARPGDRVAASLANDLDVVLAFHGAMRIGAIWVGIGEALATAEKCALIEDSAPRLFLASDVLCRQVVDGGIASACRAIAVEAAGGEWRAALDVGSQAPPVEIDIHAPAGIAYTSGTTGRPKGIVHSQHNLLLPGEVLVASRGWGPELRKGDCLPLTILNLLVLTTLLTAQATGCCVIMDRRDAAGIAEWIARAGVTLWNGVPAQLHDLSSEGRIEREALATLQEVWSGGGDLPEVVRSRFAEIYGLTIRSTYGLTEAPTVVSIDPVGAQRYDGASGQVLPHLTVQARRADGTPVDPGEAGELVVSARDDGPWAGAWTPYLGVWKDGAVIEGPDRVVATGDIGSVDADGWLRILDRLKVLVVRGGANIYPAEVERVLVAQPGVAGAAVFGVPDPRLGERVAVLVEPSPSAELSAEELKAACLAELSAYKVPERWGIVERLPRNAMGKVVRTGLIDLLPPEGANT